MGKGTKNSKSFKKEVAAPKCSCEHPFLCQCGNRPPRPSKGHKWDLETQQWGGKGHKQKGASGQIASVEQPKKEVGSTTVSQWQKLPSQLLDQVCQKEGRPPAKYKSMGNARYRVIVQDAKVTRRGTDHDLIFVPANSAETDDIAKEEAALLALVHLTPMLPHERKLPEPYKTTWLHAVEAAKQSKQRKSSTRDDASGSTNGDRDEKKRELGMLRNESKASPSSQPLVMAGAFASAAERRKHHEERERERKARIRRHEAIRMANRDHPVFMSAQCRHRIETLLRGVNNSNIAEMLAQEVEDDGESEDEENEVKAYVLQRLHTEGFTASQARTAYSQLTQETLEDESQWDSVYEECLQWLCIHLDEDQLPEGFDPRGRTLDVVVAPASKSGGRSAEKDERVLTLARKYGISDREAALVLKKSSTTTVEEVLWTTFCLAAEVVLENDNHSDSCVAKDESEALQAIFSPDECSIQKKNGTTTVKILFPSNDGKLFTLEIVVKDEVYPWSFPERVLLSGGWPSSNAFGSAVHVELVKHIATLTKGEPMIYDIYGQVTEVLHSAQDGDMNHVSLMPTLRGKVADTAPPDASKIKQETSRADDNTTNSFLARKRFRRPREKALFWSKAPKDTPAAFAFPKTSSVINNTRKELPAAKARDEFLSVMKKADKAGRVVLVTGDTGCGKTTQIPQFILEEFPADVKIVVAQPRRLAARGVATRVANERGESQPGTGSVGYVVRGDSAMCKSTRLLFCTTGVLLRQLQSDNALDCLTHIIVDEVHERHLDTDVLLGVLKACLQSTSHIRVVLMSATLDADRFAKYWGSNTPRIHIPGRMFPVTDFMLDDVLSITGYIPRKNGKKKNLTRGNQRPRKSGPWNDSERSDEEEIDISSEKSDITGTGPSTKGDAKSHSHNIPLEELVQRVDESRVDYDLLGQLVKQLVNKKDSKDDGSILVFLPGAPEINMAMDAIRKVVRGLSIQLLPLHGGLQPKDQNMVFQAAARGYTKIILSTNVAETSITIPDCTIVIDSCREKQSSYDPSNRMPLLVERFAARANLKQRRGRAGRVRSGACYKLISKKTYDNLPEHGEPEIHRCALDQTLLSLMFLGMERGTGTFLCTLLDPPSKPSADAAIISLQQLGAVTTGDGDLSLTPLGLHLAGIPAPPTVGKMIIMGCILGCREAGLAMAAGMSIGRSPFLRIDGNYRNQEEESIEVMKRRIILEERDNLFKSVGNSDHAMMAAAYLNWDAIGSGAGDRKKCCERLGLSFNGMRDLKQLVTQLDSSLSSLGYVSSDESDRNAKSWRIIRACATAALAPSQLVRVHRPVAKYAETSEGAVEKDGVAKELRFYIRAESAGDNQPGSSVTEERVFMHPSSSNFSVGSYNCPWLVYHELVRTSKAFLRDATECSVYSLLLFGGKLEVQASNGLIFIDDWVRLAANARIGALTGGLRRKVDELLSKKVDDPAFNIAATVEMKLIVNLLVSDGLGH